MPDRTTDRQELSLLLSQIQSAAKQDLELAADTFKGRIRIQKAVYLLGAMGHPFCRKFTFSNYLRGPYSPDLARVYYKDDVGSVTISEVAVPPALRKELTVVASAIARGIPFIEAASTLHSFHTSSPGESSDSIKARVRRAKPGLGDSVLKDAWQFLVEHGLVTLAA